MANNLTMTTPFYSTTAQKYGTACLNGGYGSTPTMLPNGIFTAQCWVQTTNAASTTQVFLSQRDAFYIGSTNGILVVNLGSLTAGAAQDVASGTSKNIADGAWHHIRLECSPSLVKVYLDGALISTRTSGLSITALNSIDYTTYPLYVGRFVGTTTFTYSGFIDDVAIFNTVNGAAFTPAQVTPGTAGLVALYALDSNGLDTFSSGTVTTQTITPDNAAFFYSPYNWHVTSVRAKSINAGAYFRVMFTGFTCILNFDNTNNSAPVSTVEVKIDNGVWTTYTVASAITIGLPSDNTWGTHLLEVIVKSTSQSINRWNDPSNTAVLFTGLTIDISGGALVAPLSNSLNAIVYGDSITEGVRTLSASIGSGDVPKNAAREGYAWKLCQMLGVEFGIIGFGSQGILVGGAGNVPVINSSYNLQFAGTSRAFTPSPNLVIINQGQNDGAANTVSAATTMLNNILAACPNAKIAVLRPFSGNQATNLQNAIAACSDPQRCRYIDTTGFFDTTLSADGIHPYGVANDSIAKKLLPLIKPLIASAYPGGFIGV